MKTIMKLLAAITLIAAAGWAFAAGKVNINTADVQTLSTELKGVGEKKAQAIVDYRKEHGPFKALTDLSAVKGIGDKVLEDNADLITVDSK